MNKFIMRQAQELQAKLAKAQQELENVTLEVSSGGGAVTVTVNGQQEIQSVKISPEVVDPEDVQLLEDLVLTAVREAITKSKETAAKQLGGLTGVDPEALSFSFEAATIDTPLSETKLIIEQIPAKGKCRSCGKDLQVDDFVFLCPYCDSANIDITQGKELNVEYLVEE